MALVKTTLFVHAHFNQAGQFTGYHVQAGWKYDDKVSEYGLYVLIMQKEVDIEVPEDEVMMKSQASNVVENTMKALVAKHQLRMTALLGLKNRLLSLAAPDILDAGTSDRLDALKDEDDDIPF